ncbi:hypothetical protein FISHEDRAFT_68632 [Fistulina hepatica ATCC 64428]|uniref:Uncharacterized protein n=1 Tax=Fistulina hepatica ATCC 64428 TaxID=1128425 RepID=A0A0D7ASB9_9AGAR|nr:hypothetical protein FISHEDRAFT_68632 [Fistulina hepatica ATCC 64428]
MPMRRGTLYVGDNNGGNGGAQVTFPRAVSPAIPSSVTSGHFAINASSKPFPTALQGISDGERKEKSIGNFFRPTKWFSNRSASSPKLSTTSEPRASTSSGGIRARVESNARKNDPNSRKHKISRPTDPRPILDGYTAGIGSRSVLEFDMSTPNREWETRPSGSLDLQQRSSPSTPNQSTYPPSRNNALGDLRAIARRGWSKSADDLSKFPKTDAPAWPNQNERRGALAAKLAPIATNPTALQSRIEEYRAAGPESPNVDSPVSPNLSPRPGTASPRPALVRAPSPRKFSRDDQDIHPFPTTEGVKVPSLSSSPKVPAGPMPSSLSTPLIHEETMSNPSPLTHVVARVTSSPGPTTLSFSPSPSPNLPTPPTGSPPPDMSDHGSVPLTPINGNIPSAQETPQRSTSALPPSGPPQTHSRSHSFTPRLSSKLGRTLPPSPIRPPRSRR